MEKKNMEQPYEKFVKFGAEYLTDEELLGIIIRTGTAAESAVSLGRKVLRLSRGNGLLGLHHVSLQELMTVPGIGEVKAVKIKCITELSKRMSRAKAELRLQVLQPETVADYYMEELRHMETERIILVMLDNKNRILMDKVIAIGTVHSAPASPREIMIQALQNKAVSLIVLHNHPSGDPTPSMQDLEMTKRLMESGRLIGIPLLDHIIIGDNRFVSLKEKGYIEA